MILAGEASSSGITPLCAIGHTPKNMKLVCGFVRLAPCISNGVFCQRLQGIIGQLQLYPGKTQGNLDVSSWHFWLGWFLGLLRQKTYFLEVFHYYHVALLRQGTITLICQLLQDLFHLRCRAKSYVFVLGHKLILHNFTSFAMVNIENNS